MPDWWPHWTECRWCDTPAPKGTHYETRDTEFGPQPICPRCATGEVGPVFMSPEWHKQQAVAV